MKYIVMECYMSHAVVLDEDGRFLKVANRNYQVGQKVTDVMEMKIPEPQTRSMPRQNTRRRWVYSLAAVAAVFVLVFASMLQINRTVYASLYMSINPEVKIEVNRFDRVINLEGINEDGRDLIEDYDYKNKKLKPLIDELIDRAIDKGYLHEGGKLTLTLDSKSNEWVESRSESLSNQVNNRIRTKLPADSVNVEVIDKKTQSETTDTTDYGDSDYDDSSYDDTDYDDSDYDDSDYDPDEDGDTDYDDRDDDSDDDDSDYNPDYDDDDDSDYDDDDDSDDGDDDDSDYDDDDDSDDGDDDDSDYDDSYDDDDSDYDSSDDSDDSTDDDTDYE